MKQAITFDQMFLHWMEAEINQFEGRNILPVAQQKGFTSITEWRLQTALTLGLDKLSWQLTEIKNPNNQLPQILVGPYQGWSQFFKNTFSTSFEDLVNIPAAQNWLATHDRINPVIKKFPKQSTIILLQKPNGEYICIEGGHRVCATAYAQIQMQPINFTNKTIFAAVAKIPESYLRKLKQFLAQGTNKKPC